MIVAVTGLSTHVFFKLKVGQVILVDFHYEFVYGVWFVFYLGHVLIMAQNRGNVNSVVKIFSFDIFGDLFDLS
jgi:hypothetical protein